MARRRGWRYFATRLDGEGGETVIDLDLPIEDVTIEETLSGDAAISGTISPVYSKLLGPDGKPLLLEWSTAIYAENNGDIRGGGILTESGFEGSEWSLEAVGFTGYLEDLPYIGSGYKGVKVDPIDVVRTIWGHAQGKPGGDLGLELDNTTTKGKVSIGTELKQVEFDTQSGPVSFESGPYKLNQYTNHDLKADVNDLASETPFDYREKHSWRADGTIRHFLEIGYPKLGLRRTDLRFNFGVNIFEPPSIQRSGANYASGTLVLGAGEGAAMIRTVRETPKRPQGRLRRIAVVVDDTIRSKKKADQRADLENQWRSKVEELESVIVRDHPNARLGSVKVGDEILLEGRGDWVDVSMWVRVLAISYQPANGNMAEYTIARTDKLIS